MLRAPSAARLLDAWESGLALAPIRRALTLLAEACPDSSVEELAALPVGERDCYLAELRRILFGPELSIVASCPACGERLESSFQIDDIWSRRDGDVAGSQTCAESGYRMTFRLPTSQDLLALAAPTEGQPPRNALLVRCLTEVLDEDGHTVEAASLPAHVVAAVEREMTMADPHADVQLRLACPSCAHGWQPSFDIGAFLWHEVHAWARRTLREVHGLARAYGWCEADVLALSPTRRTVYLELAGQ